MAADYETMEAAQQARARDSQDFQDEMQRQRPRTFRRVMKFGVEVSTGECTQQVDMTVPLNNMREPTSISITLFPQTVTDTTGDLPEQSGVTFMQTDVMKTRRNHRRRLYHLLQGLQEQLRGRAALRRRRQLQDRLDGLIHQVVGILGMLESTEALAHELTQAWKKLRPTLGC